MKHLVTRACVAALVGASMLASAAIAQSRPPIDPDKARVIEFWTKERRDAAIPRDLRIDERGLGYLRHRSGYLQPYGHDTPAVSRVSDPTPSPFGKPSAEGSGSDTTPPTITNMKPGSGETIGTSATFSATVTDASRVKSVNVLVSKGGGREQSFTANNTGGDTWAVDLLGFSDGDDWSWRIKAVDGARNTKYSELVGFIVNTAGASGGGGDGMGAVTNARWVDGGAVQKAAGRIYFEMPANPKGTRWNGYVCSGTVATDDGTAGRSVIITAAHCVYDDVNKAFARNVMFIPNQDDGGSDKTDRNCDNDLLGCWVPSAGVVDQNWATRSFPDNIPWDYAFYVVSDSGAHQGTGSHEVLDSTSAAGSMGVQFSPPAITGTGNVTHALGYSYSNDPNFMYCAEGMTTNGDANWWLASCGLSGGSSGGPWVQPMNSDTGDGPIISVNSWGYTTSPGMAGPKLSGTSAQCLFSHATGGAIQDTIVQLSQSAIWTASSTCPAPTPSPTSTQ